MSIPHFPHRCAHTPHSGRLLFPGAAPQDPPGTLIYDTNAMCHRLSLDERGAIIHGRASRFLISRSVYGRNSARSRGWRRLKTAVLQLQGAHWECGPAVGGHTPWAQQQIADFSLFNIRTERTGIAL